MPSCDIIFIQHLFVILYFIRLVTYFHRQSTEYLESVYSVRLGIYNVCRTEDSQKEYKVTKVYIHELYATKMPYYDLCLLILDKNTDEFLPACLPTKGNQTTQIYYLASQTNLIVVVADNNRAKEGIIQGLGVLKYQGSIPCTLREARILIYSDKDCKKMINSTGNDGNALQHAICAGYISGGIDACQVKKVACLCSDASYNLFFFHYIQGDSGGPLLVTSYDGRYILQGTVFYTTLFFNLLRVNFSVS